MGRTENIADGPSGGVGRRPSVAEGSDEDLMKRLRHGDQFALAELVRRYQNDIFRFCFYYVREVERAKDIAQETFLRVYSARGRFDETRKFRPWILCIARNLSLNELKRNKTVQIESLEQYASTARGRAAAALHAATDDPAETAMVAERRVLLAEALETLDEEAREIIVLRYFQRMSARDIAQIVGGSEGSVRTRLHRILKTLRDEYQGLKENL